MGLYEYYVNSDLQLCFQGQMKVREILWVKIKVCEMKVSEGEGGGEWKWSVVR